MVLSRRLEFVALAVPTKVVGRVADFRRKLSVGFSSGGRSSLTCVVVAVVPWSCLRRISSSEWRLVYACDRAGLETGQ